MARHGKHGLVNSIAVLKERCAVDPVTHCWNWLGGNATPHGNDMPVLWAFDHARGEKRTMTGPLAVWNIAHGEAPHPGQLVFRCCGNGLCLNPAHLRRANSRAEIGLHQRRSGSRKGTAVAARTENLRRAWAVRGIVPTEQATVSAVRAAGPEITGRALAQLHGISEKTVSRIRRGQSHKGVA